MTNQDPTISLAQELIQRASVTPNDHGCQEILISRLSKIGFECEKLNFADVSNLWAKHGTSSPCLVFVGHTDVVPPGPLDQWQHQPFSATIENNMLYGRGAADMKGSVAAMVVACENFIKEHPQHKGSIAWVITSDEEGPNINGTRKVIEVLQQRGENIDYCLVGESSCEKQFGDTIKIGRRGSLSGTLKIQGKQGHVAYPMLADNAIHRSLPFLNEFINIQWDKGNEVFPPTSFQISNIHAGTGANNVIPGEIIIEFNLRYSSEITVEQIKNKIQQILEQHKISYQLDWHHSGQPFFTQAGKLVDACCSAIEKYTGVVPKLSTSGGTSDGRFFANINCQIVEFGPLNETIHQINEHISVLDLITLTKIYQNILNYLLV